MIYNNIKKAEKCSSYVNVSVGEGENVPHLAVCFYPPP